MNKLKQILTLCLISISLIRCSEASITEINVSEITQQYLDSHLIIDVREPDEFASGYIENAVLIPMGSLQAHLPAYLEKLFTNKTKEQLEATPILLYCRSGNRYGVAADFLQKQGYSNVVSLKGGIKSWKAHNKEIKLK